jgi:hypothetical protein
MFRRRLLLLASIALFLGSVPATEAAAPRLITLDELTASANRIFRGRCIGVEVGTADLAGARIPMTEYTFRVSDHLKGSRGDTITFRQVGTPKRGPRDLGRLGGIPIYSPGTEYVLFLLPDSSAGLTSPAGAGQGAFVISGDRVQGVPAGNILGLSSTDVGPSVSATAQHNSEMIRYEELRRAVLEQVDR